MERKQTLIAELKMKLKHVMAFNKWNWGHLTDYSISGN